MTLHVLQYTIWKAATQFFIQQYTYGTSGTRGSSSRGRTSPHPDPYSNCPNAPTPLGSF